MLLATSVAVVDRQLALDQLRRARAAAAIGASNDACRSITARSGCHSSHTRDDARRACGRRRTAVQPQQRARRRSRRRARTTKPVVGERRRGERERAASETRASRGARCPTRLRCARGARPRVAAVRRPDSQARHRRAGDAGGVAPRRPPCHPACGSRARCARCTRARRRSRRTTRPRTAAGPAPRTRRRAACTRSSSRPATATDRVPVAPSAHGRGAHVATNTGTRAGPRGATPTNAHTSIRTPVSARSGCVGQLVEPRRAERRADARPAAVILLVLDAFVHEVQLFHRHLAAALGGQRRPGPLLRLRVAERERRHRRSALRRAA